METYRVASGRKEVVDFSEGPDGRELLFRILCRRGQRGPGEDLDHLMDSLLSWLYCTDSGLLHRLDHEPEVLQEGRCCGWMCTGAPNGDPSVGGIGGGVRGRYSRGPPPISIVTWLVVLSRLAGSRDVERFRPDRVEEGLFIGKAPNCPEDYALLQRLGVTDVLNLQEESESLAMGLRPEVTFAIASRYGLTQHRVEIEDFSTNSLIEKGPEAVSLLLSLRRKGRCVFVHCTAGMNRSPTIVVAYLCLGRGLPRDEALRLLMELHPSNPDLVALNELVRGLSNV